jgi:hypothetical protein
MTPQFPSYVHSVFSGPTSNWPVVGQIRNACSFTSLANVLNTRANAFIHTPAEFIREAGPLFQPNLGGTVPALKVWQLRKRGYGSHFGNLRYTNCEYVLCQLIDMGIPCIIDIYTARQVGLTRVFGQHAVVLVGYSDQFIDENSQARREYYIIDSQWPALGDFQILHNNVDRDGDGIAEDYPGNRTLARAEFLQIYSTRCYAPIFPSQLAHDRWYSRTFRARTPSLWERYMTGSNDVLARKNY